MRVLWICNIMLPMIAEALGRDCSNKEGWITGLMDALLEADCGMELGVAFPVAPGEKLLQGQVRGVHYFGFRENTEKPEIYDPAIEQDMQWILQEFKPQLLHCFGTEYPHTLAAVRIYGRPERTLIGIQGLCSVYADAYMANIPCRLQVSATFRDRVRKDTLKQQQEKFRMRGQWEQEAVKLAGHVAGRTEWDRYWTAKWNPEAQYHILQETLRLCFYQGKWEYENCSKHTLFVSQGDYPIKGLHYLLEAMPEIMSKYPDTHVYVAGNCVLRSGWTAPLKISAYGKYLERLIRDYQLTEHVTFVGRQSGEQMKQYYLNSNAYVCPSSIENSPNSLGEAMLLGVPVITADVGGIPSMVSAEEGWLYSGFCREEPGEREAISRRLADQVLEVFEQESQVTERTMKARTHAEMTHNRKNNLQQLICLYRELTT